VLLPVSYRLLSSAGAAIPNAGIKLAASTILFVKPMLSIN
jgi:hypothetical protein